MAQQIPGDFSLEVASINSGPLTTRKPTACEWCHVQRKRCRYNAGTMTCISCHARGLTCRARRKKRMGRRPVVQVLPAGSGTNSVMDLDSGERENTHTSSPEESEPPSNTNTLNLIPNMDLDVSSTTCLRPVIYQPIHFAPEEKKLARTLCTREGFFHVHRPFLMGETFSDDFQTTLTTLLKHAPDLLAHGYRATLKLMDSHLNPSHNPESSTLSLGSSSLQSFRHLSTSSLKSIQDAAVILMLAQILLAYNALLWLGATRTIARSALLAVQHAYPALRQRPEYDCLTITPLMVDIIDSLLRRQVPVLRPPESTRCVVDRSAGVLSSLLPILYDLCERSHAVRTQCPLRFEWEGEGEGDAYADIERRVEAWTPAYPPDFFTRYTPGETYKMVQCATIYRLTTLLVIHRLRFPLGQHDAHGTALANHILDEVTPLSRISTEGATGLNMDFPLLVAAVECPFRGTAVARLFEPLRFCKAQMRSNFRFVGKVRRACEEGFGGSWLDLVDGLYEGDVLP